MKERSPSKCVASPDLLVPNRPTHYQDTSERCHRDRSFTEDAAPATGAYYEQRDGLVTRGQPERD
jgi:hypothetical protein